MMPNNAVTRNNNMRTDEYIWFYDGVMSDVIPTPQNAIVANFNERLNGVVLKNKAVLANFFCIVGAAWTDVG